jgi:cobalt-precorrin-7 (C5)-methyltransferase
LGKNVEVSVVPGVSAVQACAARLCMCWDKAVLFAFHDRANKEDKIALATIAKAGKDVIILPDSKGFTPKEIAVFLLKAGVDGKTQVAVCENLTLSDEKVVETTLEKTVNVTSGPLCVMVVRTSLTKKKHG